MDENAVNTSTESSYSEPAVDTTPDYSEPTDTGSESTVAEPSDSNTVASVDTDDGGISLVKDAVTGKVSLQFGTNTDNTDQENEAPQEPTEAPEGTQPLGTDSVIEGQEVVNAPIQQYNLEEFSQALANGYVDPNRVPQEYQAQYADYRIREAIQQRQAQQQIQAQKEMEQRQRIAEQMTPENRIQANKDFYNALEEEATNLALKDLGMTQEQLDESEFADDGDEIKRNFENAKSWHKDRLRNEMQARYQQEQAYRNYQQGLYQNIGQFVAEEKAKEPNFDAIDRNLATRYKTLPYEQGRMVESALLSLQNGTINQQGLQVIQDYYNACRKEFYAQKNGLKVNGAKPAPKKPPVVENAGQGQQVNHSYKPNYKDLRNANVDQRSAWFSEYFKNNGW